MIDSFQESFKQVGNDEALAYFYCDRNQPDRRDPSLILSSFVRQLATPRDDDSIHRSIVREYTKARQTAFASGKLKMAESQALLAELFEGNPQTILVVDALDECDETTRLDFMNILDKLIYESSTPVKVFVSSRRDRDIKDHFEHVLNMEITATDNKDDIATFVNHRIATSPRYWQDIISQETKGRICGIIEAKSEGM